MKIKNHEISLMENPNKLVNMLLTSRMGEDPMMSVLLLNNCTIKNTDEGIAHTVYNNDHGLFNIFINFDYFENIEKYVANIHTEKKSFYLLFGLYHELTHNILKHFSRKKIKDYSKKYHNLVNGIIDYNVNYFVDDIIGGNLVWDFIGKAGFINYDMLDLIRKGLKIKEELPFSKYSPPPLEEFLIEWFIERADQEELEKTFGNIAAIGDHDKFKFEDEELKEGSVADAILDGKVNVMMESAVSGGYSKSSSSLYERWLEINKKDPYLNFIQVDATLRSLTKGKERRTYSRINRHHPFSNIIRKGTTPETMPPLCILIDCSGSISDKDLKKFTEIMGGYIDKGGSLEVIYWSSSPIDDNNFHRNITSWEQVRKLKPESSGGTDIRYAYEFIAKEYKDDKVTICVITDGYWTIEPLPENVSKSYFVLTEDYAMKSIQEAYPGSIVKMIKVN